MDDIFSLFTADDPTAQEKAAAMAAALRRTQGAAAANRGLSMVAGLGQNSLLQGLGQSSARTADALGQQAQFGQQQLAAAAQQRAQHALQRTMAKQQQDFQRDENISQQAFQGSENRLNRKADWDKAMLEVESRELIAKQKAIADAKKQALEANEGFRKEFNALPEVRQYKEAATALDKVERGYQLGKSGKQGAADVAMVYGYIKLLDPGAAVQQGDIANANASDNRAAQQMIGLYNSLLQGGKLSEGARENLLQSARQQIGAYESKYDDAVSRYRGLATKNETDPNQVVAPRGVVQGADGKAYRVVNGQYVPAE